MSRLNPEEVCQNQPLLRWLSIGGYSQQTLATPSPKITGENQYITSRARFFTSVLNTDFKMSLNSLSSISNELEELKSTLQNLVQSLSTAEYHISSLKSQLGSKDMGSHQSSDNVDIEKALGYGARHSNTMDAPKSVRYIPGMWEKVIVSVILLILLVTMGHGVMMTLMGKAAILQPGYYKAFCYSCAYTAAISGSLGLVRWCANVFPYICASIPALKDNIDLAKM